MHNTGTPADEEFAKADTLPELLDEIKRVGLPDDYDLIEDAVVISYEP